MPYLKSSHEKQTFFNFKSGFYVFNKPHLKEFFGWVGVSSCSFQRRKDPCNLKGEMLKDKAFMGLKQLSQSWSKGISRDVLSQ